MQQLLDRSWNTFVLVVNIPLYQSLIVLSTLALDSNNRCRRGDGGARDYDRCRFWIEKFAKRGVIECYSRSLVPAAVAQQDNLEEG
jgi:hypothetical protein